MRTLSWALIACAVAVLVGGLIYDGTREGEAPNLAPLYIVGVAIALIALCSACRTREGVASSRASALPARLRGERPRDRAERRALDDD
jgi:uncharacterized membrane protein